MSDFEFVSATVASLFDGSQGTLVRLSNTLYDDYQLTLDRFGDLQSRVFDGGFNQYTNGVFYYRDGSSRSYGTVEGYSSTETVTEADGTIIERVTIQGDTTVTTTEPNPIVSMKISDGRETGIQSARIDYLDGQRDVTLTDASGAQRVLQYDAAGKVDLEQRFDASHQLTYEVRGRADGEHVSTIVRNGTTSITSYGDDGKTIRLIETIRADHTHETYGRVAGVTFGGETGNDSYNAKLGGADTFVFGAKFGNDTIRGFETADVLKFLDPNVDADDISLTYTGNGRNTVLHVGNEGTITLLGVHVDTVNALHIVPGSTDPNTYHPADLLMA